MLDGTAKHTKKQTYDVLIVGAGPAGLLAAYLLNQLKLSCLVIEKSAQEHPQKSHAHFLNVYSLRILQAIGITIDRQDPHAISNHDMVFCQSFNNLYLKQKVSSEGINYPQPLLKEKLTHKLQQENIEIVYQHQWQTAQYHGMKWHSQIDHQGQNTTITSRWLIGADGAHSPVQKMLAPNKPIMNHGTVETWAIESLILPKDCQDAQMLWIYNPKCAGCLVKTSQHNHYILHLFSPGNSITPETLAQRLKNLGAHGLNAPINHGRWQIRSGLTSNFQQNGALIIGDAAHEVPPSGGHGLNLALADAQSVCWRIAQCHHHKTDLDDLDQQLSQQQIRAQSILNVSRHNLDVFLSAPTYLGLPNTPWITQTLNNLPQTGHLITERISQLHHNHLPTWLLSKFKQHINQVPGPLHLDAQHQLRHNNKQNWPVGETIPQWTMDDGQDIFNHLCNKDHTLLYSPNTTKPAETKLKTIAISAPWLPQNKFIRVQPDGIIIEYQTLPLQWGHITNVH